DVGKMKMRRLIADKVGASSPVFSPDGKSVAALQTDGLAGVYSVETGKPVQAVRVYKLPLAPRTIAADGKSIIGAVTFSGDGKALTTGDADGVVKVWEVATGKIKATQTIKAADPLVFAPSAKSAASDATKGAIDVWDLATGKRQTTLKGPAVKG